MKYTIHTVRIENKAPSFDSNEKLPYTEITVCTPPPDQPLQIMFKFPDN